MADTPILSLETLIKRPLIEIDGERYEILSPDELSVVDFQRLSYEGTRISGITGGGKKLTLKEEKELTTLIVSLSDRIMVDGPKGVPQEVRDKLSEAHRLVIAEGFMSLPWWLKLRAEAKQTLSTGAKPPADSKDSTAATLDGGSTKPPSPS